MLHTNTQSIEQIFFSVKGKRGINDLGLGKLRRPFSRTAKRNITGHNHRTLCEKRMVY